MAVRTALLPDRYRDPRLIAIGGMGEVYRATDGVLGREVAVKVMDDRHASDENVRERFMREARAAARLSSEPGIVMIYDVGEYDARPFIVMEYLPGGTLQDVLDREGAQPPGQVLRWLGDAAAALDRAHARGIVHRDVKPANLLLDGDGRVHVADFGVASAVGLASLTQTGTVIGTAGYLSPEKAQGGQATPASDRYGLAVVAWELLAGARPFQNESPTAEATAHVWSPVPSLSALRQGMPLQVDAVFAHALAKPPDHRYPSSVAFIAALRGALAATATTTRVVQTAVPLPRRAAPRRSPFLLPLVLVLLGVAGVLAAVIVANRGGGGPARIVRVTVTRPGTTLTRTVRAAPASPQATTTPTTSAPSGEAAAAEGFAKMRAGDYAGALPLLQQAAHDLQGTGSLNEAYNDFNLALTLARTQGCSAQVLQLLDASQAIQGHRPPIDELRRACTTPAPRPHPDHGPKPGKGPKPDKGQGQGQDQND